MPSKTPKQARFMQAIAHSRKFAKKAGVPQSVGKEFNDADKKKKVAQDDESSIGYWAHASHGKKDHETEIHPTREAAVKAAVAAMPKAKSVSTARARNGIKTHSSIEFHNTRRSTFL